MPCRECKAHARFCEVHCLLRAALEHSCSGLGVTQAGWRDQLRAGAAEQGPGHAAAGGAAAGAWALAGGEEGVAVGEAAGERLLRG